MNRNSLILIGSLLLLSIILAGCQTEQTMPVPTGAIADLSCQGDLVISGGSDFFDCSTFTGVTGAFTCREDVRIKAEDGTLQEWGARCVECSIDEVIGDCPAGYLCGSFDDPDPFICYSKEVPLNCIDSDGGDNYLVAGFVTDSGSLPIYDACFDDELLVEMICTINDRTDYIEFNCKTEFGADWVCQENIEDCGVAGNVNCGVGACVQKATSCVDTDTGLDFFKVGTVTKADRTEIDRCTSTNELREYFCGDNSIDSILYNCGSAYTCDEGACERTPTTCDNDNICEIELGETKTNCADCIDAECFTHEDCGAPACAEETVRCVNAFCETLGSCPACTEDIDCNDEDKGTIDTCFEGRCQNTQKPFDFAPIIIFSSVGLAFIIFMIFYLNRKKRRGF